MSNNSSNNEIPSVSAHSAQHKTESNIILATAEIHIFDVQGRPHKCRALMDCGSQSNFITNELFCKLGLPASKIHIPVTGFNRSQTYISQTTFATIKSSHSSYETNLSFLVTNHITQNLPTISFDIENMNIPNNIILADSTFNQSGRIDILLGANIFWELINGEQLKLGKNQPFLQSTKLGWIISGPTTPSHAYKKSGTLCHLNINNDIRNKIEMFWKVEECLPDSKFSKEEVECEQHYIKTTSRDSTGRYIVSLPFRDNVSKLGDSKEVAIKRFYSTENKLSKNSELKRQYIDFMDEYLSLGHMTKVNPEDEPQRATFYLPHHGVIKESSLTTKLRVVFDGSALTSTGISLNDTLKVGPTIQDELFSIVIRFRKHRYVITADVAKMYRQVNILPEQRHFQRIVWRSDPEQPLGHYNLNTVTYGTSSASFLAIRSLQQVAFDNKNKFPQVYDIIRKDFYVDDLLTGTDTIQNAIILKRDIDTVLQSGGFILRKWISNNNEILRDVADNEMHIPEYHISDDKNTKTLGLLWDAKKDVLRYKVNVQSNILHSQVTKRFILSTISQIFDPLGIIGPVTVNAKIIMQQLWQLKLGWDEPIPLNLCTIWIHFYNNLSNLNNIAIPRHVLCSNPVEIQLHGFSDASESAYGASIFMRSIDNLGNIHTNLLCSRSRVAPLKTITLPRLELCGAQLLAQLSRKVINSLNIKISNIFYWCDSTIVITWISMEPNKLKTFVAHRVTEIQQCTEFNQWRHINSQENPSDIISRGLNPDKLINAKLWWTGPIWLSKDSNDWPVSTYESPTISNIPEIRNTNITFLITNLDQDIFILYSSLSKLQRIIAYCLRFINNLTLNKESKISGSLKISELNKSMISLLKLAQSNEFLDDIQSLKTSNKVSSASKLLSLNPFLDENNLIRVGGRLRKSNLKYNHKYPVVLASKHPLTKLIINYEHIRNLHSGVQATLSAVRANYWPLNGRSTVRHVLHACIICFKVSPPVLGYQMSDLPESRVTPARPFSVVGIDYAGPFSIKDGKTRNRKIVKCYLSLFVCLSTKAVHLELVNDLSTDSFLNALKRFVSRRGLCQQIYSDNGTNFVGANNELKILNDFTANVTSNPKFKHFLSDNRIKWKFIPPRSPHFGGIWEAAVKSAKYHLKRILGNIHLTFEELYTLFTQIEAVLNSRPLIPLSSDPNDLSSLTPGHFLIGETLTALPQQDVTEIPINKLSQFKKLQQLSQHFWLRWSKDYLSHLQQRSKWKQRTTNQLEIVSLVLLKDENIQPLNWKLARVINTHPGDDGVIHVVTVKTVNGVTKRAVKKICLLPTET